MHARNQGQEICSNWLEAPLAGASCLAPRQSCRGTIINGREVLPASTEKHKTQRESAPDGSSKRERGLLASSQSWAIYPWILPSFRIEYSLRDAERAERKRRWNIIALKTVCRRSLATNRSLVLMPNGRLSLVTVGHVDQRPTLVNAITFQLLRERERERERERDKIVQLLLQGQPDTASDGRPRPGKSQNLCGGCNRNL